MNVEIDQSGKVEDTARRTALGDSLGNFIIISAADKKSVQRMYRSVGQPRLFVVQLFSLLVSLLIARSASEGHSYIIDPEYPGKEDEIAELIDYFTKKLPLRLIPDQMEFRRVGKSSLAHATAHKAFKAKRISATVNLKDVLRYLLPQKMDRAL